MKNFKLIHKTTLQFAFLLVVLFAAISSCCIPKAPTPPDYKIKSTTDIEYGEADKELILLEYNAEDKLKRWPTSPSSWYAFTYLTGQVSMSSWYNNTISGTVTIPLNANGYAIKDLFSNDLTFNTQGYLIKQENSKNRIDYSYDADNNLIKEQTTNINSGIITRTVTYTYYTDKKDRRVDGLEWLKGKHSTYLAASKTTQYNGNPIGVTQNYTYVLDSYGRVTQKSITQGNSTPVNYTYGYFN